jgi:hypothetical protein
MALAEIVLVLPSGGRFKVERASLMDFVYGGSIPTPLLSTIASLGTRSLDDPAEMRKYLDAMNAIVLHVVLDPTVVQPQQQDGKTVYVDRHGREHARLGPGMLPIDRIRDIDKMAVWRFAMADAGLGRESERLLNNFLEQYTGGNGAAPVVQGVRGATAQLLPESPPAVEGGV